jgi:hypothetical protein
MLETAEDLKPMLLEELRTFPQRIAEAVRIVNAEKEALAHAQEIHDREEANLLLAVDEEGEPCLKGKNEAIRKALLFRELAPYRTRVEQQKTALREAERQLELWQNRFRAARAMAMLLSGDER